VLRDKDGKSILAIPHLTYAGGLLSFLRPVQRTLALDDVAVDLERRADGSTDLEEALAPLFARQSAPEPEAAPPSAPILLGGLGLPKAAWVVSIVNGSLRFKSPELPEPFSARRVDGAIKHGGASAPTTYRLSLANPTEGDNARLEVTGNFSGPNRADPSSQMSMALKAERWPWSFSQGETRARGRFQGTLLRKRQKGLSSWTGDGRWLDLDVAGPSLAGDRLQLDEVKASYELAETEQGWDFRQLDFRSPLGSLRAVDPATRAEELGSSTRIEGKVDLAALTRQLPHTFRIREGLEVEQGEATLTIDIAGTSVKDVRHLMVEANLSDLRAREEGRVVELRQPGSFKAKLYRRAGGFGVEELGLKTAFLQAKGSGDFDRGVTVSATLDLERLQQELKTLVDFGNVTFTGKGQLAADYRHASGDIFASRVSAEFQALKIVGLSDDPITRDRLRVDVTTKGTTADWGLPESWSHTQVGVKSDALTVEASLASKPSDSTIVIDALRASFMPTAASASSKSPTPTPSPHRGPAAPRRGVEPIRFAARGRYDPMGGVFELQPMSGGSRPEPFALAGNGLRVVGLGSPERHMELNLVTDLGRLDRALANFRGKPGLGLRGKATLKGGAQLSDQGKVELGANLESVDISVSKAGYNAQRSLGPAVISLRLLRVDHTEPLRFEPLIIAGPCARLDATGSVDQEQRLEIKGQITPIWEAIDQLLAQAIAPGSRVRGEPRPFVLHAQVNENDWVESLGTLEGELGFDRVEANMLGMQIAPVSIVARSKADGVVFDPIETNVNGGVLRIKPEVVVNDRGAVTIGLGAGSEIAAAEINDEVSRGFLAYMAPILGDAAHVRGRFSAQVDRAEFPLTGQDSHTEVVGKMKFDDVLFDAGNLTGDLLGMAGSRRNAQVRLSEPIELRVTGGRVYQRGLSLPIGRNAHIVLEGSVGLDRTLALRARLPIARGALGGNGEFDDLVENLRVGVPISGTLSRPQIDSQALRLGLRNVNKSALKKKAVDLLDKLVQPEPADEAPDRSPR